MGRIASVCMCVSLIAAACGGEASAPEQAAAGAANTSGGNASAGTNAFGGAASTTGGFAATGGAVTTDSRCPAIAPLSAAAVCSIEGLLCTYNYATGCLCTTNSTMGCTQVVPSCSTSQASGVPYMGTGGGASFIIAPIGGSGFDVAPVTGGSGSGAPIPLNLRCTCTNSVWGCSY